MHNVNGLPTPRLCGRDPQEERHQLGHSRAAGPAAHDACREAYPARRRPTSPACQTWAATAAYPAARAPAGGRRGVGVTSLDDVGRGGASMSSAASTSSRAASSASSASSPITMWLRPL